MKSFYLFVVSIFAAFSLFASVAFAGSTFTHLTTLHTTPTSLVNWRVGDQSDYQLTFTNLQAQGTLHKQVTAEDTSTVTLEEDVNVMNQQQNTTAIIDRATGKVLKLTVNGQEQAVPADNLVIQHHDTESVTVPDGTFQADHIVATDNGQGLELWINPSDIVIDGTAKEILNTQYGPVELDLTGQKRTLTGPYCYF